MTDFVANNMMETITALDLALNGWLFGLITIFVFLMLINIMLIANRTTSSAVTYASFITMIPLALFAFAGYMDFTWLIGMIAVFAISFGIELWK